MAAGCPVINTAIPGSGVPWVCRHECEALTCRADDAAAFGAAAKRLLAEPGLRPRLVEAGRERGNEFGHRLMAQRTLTVYREVACASCT